MSKLKVAAFLVGVPLLGGGAWVGWIAWQERRDHRFDGKIAARARALDAPRVLAVQHAQSSAPLDQGAAPCPRKVKTDASRERPKIANDERFTSFWVTTGLDGLGWTANDYRRALTEAAMADHSASFDELVRKVDAKFAWTDEVDFVVDATDEAKAIDDHTYAGGRERGRMWIYDFAQKRVVCGSAVAARLQGTVESQRTGASDTFRGGASEALHDQAALEAAQRLVTIPP